MAVIDLNYLEDLIKLLRSYKVSSYNSEELTLYFEPSTPQLESTTIPPSSQAVSIPKSLWENESLWPGGKPPSFPK